MEDFTPADKIETIHEIEGKVTHIDPKEYQGKEKYGLRIEGELENTWFYGWGHAPCEIGDQLKFTYKINESGNSVYHNIQQIIQVNSTHTSPDSHSDKELGEIRDPELWSETIQQQNRALLMSKAVELCIKRNASNSDKIS